MARNETEIGSEIREYRYEVAMEMLVPLLKKHGGNTVHAAKDADVHHATLKRWIVALENAGQPIRQALDEMRGVSARKLARAKASKKKVTKRVAKGAGRAHQSA